MCFVLGSGSGSGRDWDGVGGAASALLVGWLPSVWFMFKEEEGVVAGFCSAFCRACGLDCSSMADGWR